MSLTPSSAAGIAAAVTLATGGCAYAALWPESQIFGRTLIAGSDPVEMALTFDDGPNDPYTLQLLELLARHDVRATFFLIGRYVRQRPDLVRQIHAVGHLIGNHTLTHPWLPMHAARRVSVELAHCNAAIEDTLGEPVRYFRPPHGARSPAVLRLARNLDLTPVLWNAVGHDWRDLSAKTIADHLERGIARNRRRGRGSNLLLHDGSDTAFGVDRSRSVAATRLILERYPPGQSRYVTVDAWKGADQR